MGGHVEENKIYRKWRAIFASVIIGFVSVYASPAAAAFKLLMAKVVDSYGACSWYNNGDGTSTIKLVVNYRGITGNLGAQAKETLINGPTSEVAGEMASNFLDDEANRRSIQ
ncbi:hypothetical protein [Burkholderia cepacia]|uniref:hypothetical protein n=1 Tax=Burkholderia cepacia TaxID=292 RepID=UPI0013F45101|nr:hypothetical protein [Burkholderia cepacia]